MLFLEAIGLNIYERERMILLGAQSQYRLKPADEYESQVRINIRNFEGAQS